MANVAEEDIATGNEWVEKLKEAVAEEKAPVVVISGAIEEELSGLDAEEQAEYLADMGMETSGLNRLIKAGYDLLGLRNFFTVGEKETRAWTIKQGTEASDAAGTIHTDMKKGFIRAEVVPYGELLSLGSLSEARSKGKLRLEGKEYIVSDGDICHIRFNV